LETEEIIVENEYRVLPWNEPVRNVYDAYRYAVPHYEMKAFIGCMAHCFDLSDFYFPAVQHEYVELIKSLLDAKVEPSKEVKALLKVRDSSGNTLLLSAFISNKKSLAHALLLLGSDVHAANYDEGTTALHYAVSYGCVEIVRDLIEAGADVNAKKNNGDTALSIAVLRNRVDIVPMLIEAGVDVNVKYSEGTTVLHWAAEFNNVKILRVLIGAGADVNANDSDGDTALYYAVWYKRAEIVKILIQAGANVNVKDKDKGTALHEAARWNCVAVSRILFEAGAERDAKNNDGDTPLDVARKRGSNEIAVLLQKENSKTSNKRKRKLKLDHHIYKEY